MIKGFKFNNLHSYKDFRLFMERKQILPPAKVKIKETVPFMNGTYDFSTIGTNGEPVYGERQIQVTLGLPTKSKEKLHILYSKILEWLQDTGRQQLIFDDICDYYFLAEVEDSPNFEELIRFGRLTVTFICQPFKIGVNLEGSDIWDTFNFETDVSQDTEFDVVDSKTVNIINVGRLVTPVINVDTNMSITFYNKTYNLVVGDNKFYDLKLKSGDNYITIDGTGNIKFLFRKEVI